MARKRAIISVYDKSGVEELGRRLLALGYELVSTGGTFKQLTQAGLEVTYISDVTGFPEILGGRVKTLHPKIHGGILAKRSVSEHMSQLDAEGIVPIELVAVNLYPFQATVANPEVTMDEALENIDIGGPTMIRASAKNFPSVIVIVNPGKYDQVLTELEVKGDLSYEDRLALAQEAFAHTAQYDAAIQDYLWGQTGSSGFAPRLCLPYEKAMDLRYGENPHQKAAFYQEAGKTTGLLGAKQLHGKELSFNNINDANAAMETLAEFTEPTAVCLKHTNPCGVAVGVDVFEAYSRAYEGDPVSIFGGIVALNREVDRQIAEKLHEIFLEIVLAPSFSSEAMEVLTTKKNLRLLEVDPSNYSAPVDYKKVVGGLLVQDADNVDLPEAGQVQTVTKRQPNQAELDDLLFAWKVVKHVKSNAIVVAKGGKTLGIGAGQMNRIDPTKYALSVAGDEVKGAVLASDAFFPMPDVVQACGENGVAAIIQPGGSIRDKDSIDEADKLGIAMVFTGMRHFKH